MPRVLRNTKPEEIANTELAKAVRQLHKISDGGYELLDANHHAIVKLLKKALKLARQEKEWYVYFEGMQDILYQYSRSGDYWEIVKYAEIFYRDCALYMEQALAKYPDTDISYLNTWIYYEIFAAYWCYHQIDDSKMDSFMKQYEENAVKYGKTFCYYECEMELATLYRDAEMAKHGALYFEKYESEMLSCYVCGHKQYLGYYLLLNNRNKAEELLLTFLHRRIPKEHLWCYTYCQEAENNSLYALVLEYCMKLGRAEDFRYFYKKYWAKQPDENWRAKEERWQRTLSMYLCAVAGHFEQMEEDLRQAEEDVKTADRRHTLDNAKDGLLWWCYFALLDRTGVHEVSVNLPGLEACAGETAAESSDRSREEADSGKQEVSRNETRLVSCLTLSRYYEKRADDYGMKFAAARKKYDYQAMKDSYWECAGL